MFGTPQHQDADFSVQPSVPPMTPAAGMAAAVPDLSGNIPRQGTPMRASQLPGPTEAMAGPMVDWDMTTLIRAVAEKRDQAAFAHLFSHFAPRVKAFVMRSLSDGEMAEEIAQEAMTQVWRKAASFDPDKAALSTWIFTIARNKRIDRLRRENRPGLDEEDYRSTLSEPETPLDAVKTGETGDELKQAIENLPEDQALVIRKAFYEDKSHAVIAQELTLPLGTVKSRIRLGLTRLKIEISKEET
jgi:RNA polymerase sigma-70 factor (ECF subfamily)